MILSIMILSVGGMMDSVERRKFINELLISKKVLTFSKMLEKVDCSNITLRRDFKMLNANASYTHQGRYVTHESIPKFNAHGIWFYKNIGFTKFRNSIDLIVELVDSSKQGLSREQIQDILGIQAGQQIQVLMQRNKLDRVRIGNK